MTLETQISEWRAYLARRAVLRGTDVAELEDHLRSQVDTLVASGLDQDEAFLVAVKRMGNLDALSREFAREHSGRLWKQLVIADDGSEEPAPDWRRDAWVAMLLALLAALAVKAPQIFGLRIHGPDGQFYALNASLFVLPLLTLYFGWKRRIGLVTGGWLALSFIVAAAFANFYPFHNGQTLVLAALHLPIALWLVVGFAYLGGRWFGNERRMDFVRFSGELFIYYVLIALGGGVLTGFTLMMFEAIGVESQQIIGEWLIPCGAAAAVIVAAWLVEAKKSVIENMAPVLTRLFTPLFTLVLLVFLGTLLWTGKPIDVQRDLLIGFDLLLALVVALVLYAASARDASAPPGWFDALQLLLIVSAVAVDVVALLAILERIADFGFTPNRVAALGENLLLLANLSGAAWLQARFLRGRDEFYRLERWLMGFLPLYCFWAAFVVIAFPPWFGYQ